MMMNWDVRGMGNSAGLLNIVIDFIYGPLA